MKKTKPKKIRKVWLFKPKTRIHLSSKKEIVDKIKKRESRESF
jgi:hypothetical protein